VFHIPEEGEPQQLEAQVDIQSGTVTVYLQHFSVYVLAQLPSEELQLGDTNADGQVNARDARLLLQYLAGLVEEELIDLLLADANEDGQVNARDARAILQQVAGLND
jgi:hypothetical protein